MAKAKLITEIEIEGLKADLFNAQTAKRRNASKKIGKLLISDLTNDLFEAYVKEPKDEKNWETQLEMIKALGRLRCKKLLPIVEKIIDANSEFDAITMVASTAFLRIKGQNNNNFEIVSTLFKIGKYAVVSGAVLAIFYDEVKLNEIELKSLIKLVNDFKHPDKKGIADVRKLLVLVLSRYPTDFIAPYLEMYRNLPSIHPLIIEEALKGKAHYSNEY